MWGGAVSYLGGELPGIYGCSDKGLGQVAIEDARSLCVRHTILDEGDRSRTRVLSCEWLQSRRTKQKREQRPYKVRSTTSRRVGAIACDPLIEIYH